MKIDDLEVSNTNMSTDRKNSYSCVRVYRNGALIALVKMNTLNPLGYIRQHKKSKYRIQLINQLVDKGVNFDTVSKIVNNAPYDIECIDNLGFVRPVSE